MGLTVSKTTLKINRPVFIPSWSQDSVIKHISRLFAYKRWSNCKTFASPAAIVHPVELPRLAVLASHAASPRR